MRPDFFLHLICTIAFFLPISFLFGWKKALVITLVMHVGKEVYDFMIDSTNIDPTDWLGDLLGILILNMKKKINFAVAALLFSIASFAQGGFPLTAPKTLADGSFAQVQQPSGNSTGVDVTNFHYSLADYSTDVSNTSTTETDLYTTTTAANTLAVVGDKLTARYCGLFNDATATCALAVKFGASTVYFTGALTLTGTGHWNVDVLLIRTGATTARAVVTIQTDAAALTTYTRISELTGMNFTTTNVIKLTGTATGAGGGTGDITAKFGTLEKKSAAL